jgi:hypothetical protein
MRLIAYLMMLCGLALCGLAGFYLGTQTQTHHANPVCIVINYDGNPAPALCSNPNSYQVSDGK